MTLITVLSIVFYITTLRLVTVITDENIIKAKHRSTLGMTIDSLGTIFSLLITTYREVIRIT